MDLVCICISCYILYRHIYLSVQESYKEGVADDLEIALGDIFSELSPISFVQGEAASEEDTSCSSYSHYY